MEEDLFGIKQISYRNGNCHHLLEYRLGNVLVTQTSDADGNILNYFGKIFKEDANDLILEYHAAQSTFTQLAHLLEIEKNFLAIKADRLKKVR
jgi:hypothetical protein